MKKNSNNFYEILDNCKKNLLCPKCNKSDFLINDTNLSCKNCKTNYPIDINSRVCSFSPSFTMNKTKNEIMDWWGDLYEQCYANDDSIINENSLSKSLIELEDMFKKRNHLAYIEMLPLLTNSDQKVLEIGPGSGGHSALFASKGIDITTIDITLSRAISTAMKLSLTGNKKGLSFQGDSETLPFNDNTFDIVYSNGVLHHTISTEKAISEVYRVLKPGGKAVLMLYSRHSSQYWLNIVPRAIIDGGIFHLSEENWIGRVTEGSPKFGKVKNPITRVYSAKQIKELLTNFKLCSLRKSSFQFDNFMLPRFNTIRNSFLNLLGYNPHEGCKIVYGEPRFIDTGLELKLGKYFGWDWNIVAKKPL